MTPTLSFTPAIAFLVKEKYGVIAVVDLYPSVPQDVQMRIQTITDLPQLLIMELKRRGFPVDSRPIVYMDENNVWDYITVHNGEFDGFRVLNSKTLESAVGALVNAGVMTRKEMKREPVVTEQFRV